jgi:hypothetical protein
MMPASLDPEPQKHMEEPLPDPATPAAAAPVARMSFFARLLNVFAVPGEVFNDVKAAPASTANWLVPVLVSALAGGLAAIIMFSQPAIQQQIKEQQAKGFDKQVEAKKMTREQADQMLAATEKFMGPTVLKIAGVLGSLFVSFVRVFWWGLVMYFLAQWFLKVKIPYMKALEVAGLSLMISVLGLLVGILLVVNLGKMFAGPSLALAVENFDVQRKSHLMLGAANVFSFWFVGVIAVGLSKLAEVPLIRAMFLVFGYWVLQECIFILTPFGQLAL